MNEIQIQALVATLQLQRNNALNAVAQSEAKNAVLHARIVELEGQLASATNDKGAPT